MKFCELQWFGEDYSLEKKLDLALLIARVPLEGRLTGVLPVVIRSSDCGHGPGVICASREVAERVASLVDNAGVSLVPNAWSRARICNLSVYVHRTARIGLAQNLGSAVRVQNSREPIDMHAILPFISSLEEAEELLDREVVWYKI